MVIFIQKLSPEACFPTRGSLNAAGYDLYSPSNVILPPKQNVLIWTDIAVCIPCARNLTAFYGQIIGRSSLSMNGIFVMPGVIDADYRGNIGIHLFNLTDQFYFIRKGDRIAQLIIHCILNCIWVETAKITQTKRGNGGFGSTGK